MWCRSYRNHVIMAFPSFDTATNSWAPQADISWPTGPARQSEFVRFSLRVTSETEAVTCALTRGKSWIDRRLKHTIVNRHEEQGRFLQSVAGLQDRRGEPRTNQRSRSHVGEPADSASVFTFDQFKSALARPGEKLSEHALQKSYAALMRLRKNGHCSWAEIKSKVTHSQERLTPIASSSRGAPSDRLPLTQRDWRRVS
jgi:hypothetical protein